MNSTLMSRKWLSELWRYRELAYFFAWRVRDLVDQVRHSQKAEHKIRQLLSQAYAELPPSGHSQLITIPGIGIATAAVLVAKVIEAVSVIHMIQFHGTPRPRVRRTAGDRRLRPVDRLVYTGQ